MAKSVSNAFQHPVKAVSDIGKQLMGNSTVKAGLTVAGKVNDTIQATMEPVLKPTTNVLNGIHQGLLHSPVVGQSLQNWENAGHQGLVAWNNQLAKMKNGSPWAQGGYLAWKGLVSAIPPTSQRVLNGQPVGELQYEDLLAGLPLLGKAAEGLGALSEAGNVASKVGETPVLRTDVNMPQLWVAPRNFEQTSLHAGAGPTQEFQTFRGRVLDQPVDVPQSIPQENVQHYGPGGSVAFMGKNDALPGNNRNPIASAPLGKSSDDLGLGKESSSSQEQYPTTSRPMGGNQALGPTGATARQGLRAKSQIRDSNNELIDYLHERYPVLKQTEYNASSPYNPGVEDNINYGEPTLAHYVAENSNEVDKSKLVYDPQDNGPFPGGQQYQRANLPQQAVAFHLRDPNWKGDIGTIYMTPDKFGRFAHSAEQTSSPLETMGTWENVVLEHKNGQSFLVKPGQPVGTRPGQLEAGKRYMMIGTKIGETTSYGPGEASYYEIKSPFEQIKRALQVREIGFPGQMYKAANIVKGESGLNEIHVEEGAHPVSAWKNLVAPEPLGSRPGLSRGQTA